MEYSLSDGQIHVDRDSSEHRSRPILTLPQIPRSRRHVPRAVEFDSHEAVGNDQGVHRVVVLPVVIRVDLEEEPGVDTEIQGVDRGLRCVEVGAGTCGCRHDSRELEEHVACAPLAVANGAIEAVDESSHALQVERAAAAGWPDVNRTVGGRGDEVGSSTVRQQPWGGCGDVH